MASGTTRRTSRVTNRTSRAGGGGVRTGSAMGILAVIGFVVLAMGIFIVYLNHQRQVELAEANRTVGIVVAAVDLQQGHKLTPQDITIRQVKVDSVEPGAYRDASDPSLIGGTLVVPVAQNQTVLRNYLGVAEERLFPNEGEREVTVTLRGQDAKDSFLRKGQIVSAFRIFTTASGNRITNSLSKRARILDVRRYDSVASNIQTQGEAQIDVTLAVSPSDAQRILAYRDSGQVKLLDGPNQEPPPSQVSLFQEWMGIERVEKELTAEVGSELIARGNE
ncbi:MAG: RcpC/CpaB family pilus assembly protein [Candidatus Caenarcaniphilales bacterium]|nr:RcpC/CpaB family pilus assembly protein [Candidatus Caenarcaniphilales bacterium]